MTFYFQKDELAEETDQRSDCEAIVKNKDLTPLLRIILEGFLESDLSLDPENTDYVLIAAKDILHTASESVKTALSYTYPMV